MYAYASLAGLLIDCFHLRFSTSSSFSSSCINKTVRLVSHTNSRLGFHLFVAQTEIQTEYETEDDDDQQDNEEAPPFHFAGAARRRNTLVEMNIAGLSVLLDILRVLLCLLHHGFLDDDCFGQVLEELVELDERALDLLDVVVAGADCA